MTEQAQEHPSAADTLKLIAAGAIVVAGLAGFYSLGNLPIWLRWIMVLASLGLAVLVGLQSLQGRTFAAFVQSSRIELRKVVWPNRQETFRATIAVFVMVLIMGVFFWGVDSILGILTRWLTGRGG